MRIGYEERSESTRGGNGRQELGYILVEEANYTMPTAKYQKFLGSNILAYGYGMLNKFKNNNS